jgi:hypothetical protein
MRAHAGRWPAALIAAAAAAELALAQDDGAPNPTRNAYFGDLHVHSGNSFDSASQGITIAPEEAYRFARGEAVEYLGRPVQRKAALDFLAVADHAEYMAVYNQARDPNGPFAATDWPRILASTATDDVAAARRIVATGFRGGDVIEEFLTDDVKRTNWQAVIELADRYNEPGVFTAFAGFEWSPTPDGRHHHRNVIFPGPEYPDAPFSALDSTRPHDLWAYAEANRAAGIDSVLIPHNPNLSGGLAFSYDTVDGRPIDADYAETKARNEPLVEITQLKGTSETHPELSPGDPFADFEIIEHFSAGVRAAPAGGYVRDAYARGLEIAARTGVNPFAFGLVGSSDTHSALSGSEEDNYVGQLGPGDDPTDPAQLLTRFNPILNMPIIRISASGLTGVWAEENTRESIFAALKRKEVFATSGPRLQVRLFAGWSYPERLIDQASWLETAYAEGVPMGGDIASGAGEDGPRFLVEAVKDPNGANLDRVQIVKVWRDGEDSHEKVFDVAWSGDRAPGEDGLVPPVGSTVSAEAATYTNDIGSARLAAEWRDPEFDASQSAVYYARALEIPTPRWTTYLAVRSGQPLPDVVPSAIQERAWTSPIFYKPR